LEFDGLNPTRISLPSTLFTLDPNMLSPRIGEINLSVHIIRIAFSLVVDDLRATREAKFEELNVL